MVDADPPSTPPVDAHQIVDNDTSANPRQPPPQDLHQQSDEFEGRPNVPAPNTHGEADVLGSQEHRLQRFVSEIKRKIKTPLAPKPL
jgi:hypothetical protein